MPESLRETQARIIDATRDYYGILGVAPNASPEQIKKAGKKQAMQFHPDRRATGDEARFKEIQEAREILEDPDGRAFYDRVRIEYQTTTSWSWQDPPRSTAPESDGRHASPPHQAQPRARRRRGLFDGFPYRDLREFIVSSLNFFSEDLEIIFPDDVAHDFRTAAKYVFAIWREIQPDPDPSEDDIIIEYGGLEITVGNLTELDL